MKKKNRYYVQYDLNYDHIKIGWGEDVKANSKEEAEQFILNKHKGHQVKVLKVFEL